MRAHVATRKGLFILARGRDGWSIERVCFLGEPVTAVLRDPRSTALYAALNLGHFGRKLHRSDDEGATWRELAAPAFPKAAEGAEAPAVELIWCLEPGGADEPGRLWAGTIPGGLFTSTDAGESWQLNTPLWQMDDRKRWMGGGYDHPGIHSISVDPRDSRRIAIAISTGGCWRSDDRGATWAVGSGMRNVYMPPGQHFDPVVQDAHRLVRCAAAPDEMWIQHHCGIFRSHDAGKTWREISEGFGFAVAVHPREPKTAWFVPAIKDEKRVPADGKLLVARTDDDGKSFRHLAHGLQATPSYDLIYRHALDVAADGKTLMMGSTTGGVWSSDDGGENWHALPARLPPVAAVRLA